MSIYDDYFKNFEPNQKAMAASLPALTYCIKLINTFKLEGVLDMGSGISTVLFNDKFKDVTSIDSDPIWGKKTSEMVKKLLDREIVVLDGISQLKQREFDFVFYDYGNLEDRIFNFPTILSLDVKYIYLDDMHILPLRYYIESKLKKERLVFLPETIDDFGRFGALLIKENN